MGPVAIKLRISHRAQQKIERAALCQVGTGSLPEATGLLDPTDFIQSVAYSGWTNRQSGYSAVRDEPSYVLIAGEAMHSSAQTDIGKLVAVIADELRTIRSLDSKIAILNKRSPRFEF